MAALLNGASVVEWAARLTGQPDIPDLLARTEAAFTAPQRLLFLPYLAGERTPHNDPHARGVLFGLTPETSPTAVMQSVLEGVAYSLLEAHDCLTAAGTPVTHAAIIGGGARSLFWTRIIASTLGIPITRYTGSESGPAFGAARLARIAATGEAHRRRLHQAANPGRNGTRPAPSRSLPRKLGPLPASLPGTEGGIQSVNDNNNTPLVAVFDIGKTNVKLNVVTAQGEVLETLSTPNPSLDGPPYRHHDLAGLEDWLLTNLAALASRHPLTTFVACGHGSGCVLVDDDGPAAPMIDYEQPLPASVERAYAEAAGPYLERGSPIMLGATHIARQMLWIEQEHPAAFAKTRHVLGVPQYWAWRLSGVAASEVTILGAQSHIWNAPDRRPAAIVAARDWQRLIPPFAPAWKALGPIRPELASRHDLPPTLQVLCGIHDSSANFYRYQAAGLADMTVVSTGTWIVGLSDSFDPAALSEARGMTCNADVYGSPLAGALTMGGREFSKVAGESPSATPADPALVARLIDRGTMALPSFGNEDGLFPGSKTQGRITGPPPKRRKNAAPSPSSTPPC